MEEVIVLDSDGEEEYFSQNLSINSSLIKEEIDDDDCSKGSDVDGADDDDDGKKAILWRKRKPSWSAFAWASLVEGCRWTQFSVEITRMRYLQQVGNSDSYATPDARLGTKAMNGSA